MTKTKVYTVIFSTTELYQTFKTSNDYKPKEQ